MLVGEEPRAYARWSSGSPASRASPSDDSLIHYRLPRRQTKALPRPPGERLGRASCSSACASELLPMRWMRRTLGGSARCGTSVRRSRSISARCARLAPSSTASGRSPGCSRRARSRHLGGRRLVEPGLERQCVRPDDPRGHGRSQSHAHRGGLFAPAGAVRPPARGVRGTMHHGRSPNWKCGRPPLKPVEAASLSPYDRRPCCRRAAPIPRTIRRSPPLSTG